MKNNFIKFTTLFFLVFLFLPIKTSAVSISPLRHLLILEPGTSGLVRLEVLNDEGTTKMFSPEVDAFLIDPKTGQAIFDQNSVAEEWIKPVKDYILLKPGEKEMLEFEVDMPQDAESGGYYLGLFAKSSPSVGQVGVGSRIGSLLFLYTSGGIKEELLKVDFFTPKIIFSPNLKIDLKTQNVGNIHLSPKGEIYLENRKASRIETLELGGDKKKVLPGGFWEEQIFFKNLNWKNFGKLKIYLNLNYGAVNHVLIDSLHVYYVPWQILLIIFGVSFGVGVLFLKIKRH